MIAKRNTFTISERPLVRITMNGRIEDDFVGTFGVGVQVEVDGKIKWRGAHYFEKNLAMFLGEKKTKKILDKTR